MAESVGAGPERVPGRVAAKSLARDRPQGAGRLHRRGEDSARGRGAGNAGRPGAAFVTLTKNGRLRGCIGYTEAMAPLFKVVQECAVAAATEIRAFPVSPKELPSLRVEISVLTLCSPSGPKRSRSAGTG